jgi:hypothetical protein
LPGYSGWRNGKLAARSTVAFASGESGSTGAGGVQLVWHPRKILWKKRNPAAPLGLGNCGQPVRPDRDAPLAESAARGGFVTA